MSSTPATSGLYRRSGLAYQTKLPKVDESKALYLLSINQNILRLRQQVTLIENPVYEHKISFLRKITNLIIGDVELRSLKTLNNSEEVEKPDRLLFRELLRLESKVGETLFGLSPSNRRRDFFCFDETTWIWHEEWDDEKGIENFSTIRYEIQGGEILKITDGSSYKTIEGMELDNLVRAAELYYELVEQKIYCHHTKASERFADNDSLMHPIV